MSAAPNEYHDDAKTRAMVREAAERAGLRITDYSIKDAAGKRTISVGFATRPEVVPDWVHELQASLMEFDYDPTLSVRINATRDESGQLEFRDLGGKEDKG